MTHRWLGLSLSTVVAASLVASTALAQEEVGTVEVTDQAVEDTSSSGGDSSGLASKIWIGGGMNFLAGEGTALFGLRVDVGIPLPVEGLAIVGTFNWAARNGVHFLGITPGIAYEYIYDADFPGALGFIGEADIGVGIATGSFGLGANDTQGAALLRFTAAVRYYLDAAPGFFVSLQPLGLSVYARNGAFTFYDFLMGAGFRI